MGRQRYRLRVETFATRTGRPIVVQYLARVRPGGTWELDDRRDQALTYGRAAEANDQAERMVQHIMANGAARRFRRIVIEDGARDATIWLAGLTMDEAVHYPADRVPVPGTEAA